jgi:hypothetical protein
LLVVLQKLLRLSVVSCNFLVERDHGLGEDLELFVK